MGHWVPHTDEEIQAMLGFIGLSSLDELFSVVPEALRLAGGLDLPPGMSEPEVLERLEALAGANQASQLTCFAGGGAYDHEVPPVTAALASRSEFVTSYTPYQPEVAQGVLQALFEYQTMVAELSGLEVANASLYDGAHALAEALHLAASVTGRAEAWVSQGVNPAWRQVAWTLAEGSGLQLRLARLGDGRTAWPEEPGHPAAVVAAYPNYLGCLEDLDQAARLARRCQALLVVAYDPVAVGLLRPPGEWGADLAVAEGQCLGTPLSFGGPYLGLFSTSADHVRRLPGRLVGETVDSSGRRAYVSTLRTREQDIRRERATSNVCTNQTLLAVAAAIQLGWLGPAGLAEVALRCARATRYCREGLLGLDGVEPAASAPVLREFAVRVPLAAETLLERLADAGYLAGLPLGEGMEGSGCEGGLLVAVTEKRTAEEIDGFVAAFGKALR
ncbi:MAG TPA: aminomethyl-transferring glycine dehydrogenase subunit GcvPA [Acidimicrobiales bacterium]|nr:aminomethyl-transferring glycine dehydrogenase subunit GcvPA [Acidimicrobiales bacterium]